MGQIEVGQAINRQINRERRQAVKRDRKKTRLAFVDGPKVHGVVEIPKEPVNKEAWANRGAINLQRADDHQTAAGRICMELGRRLLRSRVDPFKKADRNVFDVLQRELQKAKLHLRLCQRRWEDQTTGFIDAIMGGTHATKDGQPDTLYTARTRELKKDRWRYFNGEEFSGPLEEAKRMTWSEAHALVFHQHRKTKWEAQVHKVRVKMSVGVDRAMARFHRKLREKGIKGP